MCGIAAWLRREEAGFSYLTLMVAIILMGLAMTAAAKQWKTIVQRELETDLLAKGIEIQTALALYSAHAKAGRVVPGEIYPQTLAELTKPPKPYLRKVYLDPVGRGEWELLRAPTGGIMGVRSKSRHKPVKQSNFPLAVGHFQGKPTYYDWVFQHPNPSGVAVTGFGTGSGMMSGQPVMPHKSNALVEPPPPPPSPPMVQEGLPLPDDTVDSAGSPPSVDETAPPEPSLERVSPMEMIP